MADHEPGRALHARQDKAFRFARKTHPQTLTSRFHQPAQRENSPGPEGFDQIFQEPGTGICPSQLQLPMFRRSPTNCCKVAVSAAILAKRANKHRGFASQTVGQAISQRKYPPPCSQMRRKSTRNAMNTLKAQINRRAQRSPQMGRNTNRSKPGNPLLLLRSQTSPRSHLLRRRVANRIPGAPSLLQSKTSPLSHLLRQRVDKQDSRRSTPSAEQNNPSQPPDASHGKGKGGGEKKSDKKKEGEKKDKGDH